MDIPASSEKAKTRKSENYTVAEDQILIAAWDLTSEDIVVGTDQAKSQYRNRMWIEYTANARSYPTRSEKSIVNRFSIIRTKCLKFVGVLQSIENANPSGMIEQDKFHMAITTWANEEKEKGGFKLFHCYHALKNSPKWIIKVVHTTAARSTPTSGLMNIGEDFNSIGHVELKRPIGRKAEKKNKRKRKLKAEDNGESQATRTIRESNELMQQFHFEKMTTMLEDTKKMDAFLEMKMEKL